MGQVLERKAKLISVTPTVDTSAYASGDHLGDLQELVNALDDTSGTGTIVSVSVVDRDSQSAEIDVLFFSAQPTIASSDNDALDISDDEMSSKFLGAVKIESSNYISLANCSAGGVKNAGLLVSATGGSRSLWAQLRSGGSPTYGSPSNLTLKIGISQD